ncbi:MAG: VanW family protein [Patescibacteria group bacterium]|jgi:vancomycin resistance protein YoaR
MAGNVPFWRRLPRPWVLAASFALAVGVFLVGMAVFFEYGYEGKIFPNTYVAGIRVGSLTEDQAVNHLLAATDAFREEMITVRVDDNEPKGIRPVDVGAEYDVEGVVESVYLLGRSGTPLENFLSRTRATVASNRLPLIYTYDESALGNFLETLSTQYDEPEVNAAVEAEDDSSFTITTERSGARFDQEAVRAQFEQAFADAKNPGEIAVRRRTVLPGVTKAQLEGERPLIERILVQPLALQIDGVENAAVGREQIGTWITVSAVGAPKQLLEAPAASQFTMGSAVIDFDREKVLAYAKTLSEQVAQDPVDARLTIQNGKATVFTAGRDGRRLKVDESADLIVAALRKRVTAANGADAKAVVKLPVELTKATVTSSTVDDLGIKELIGTAKTDFSGSPSNRVHNIAVGTKYLNGWLLKPGEEFSTVKALGEVNAATGYLPELVIKENRTIPEYGGGLCQVSTTLFRSVLQAGLPITERRNHSYRVSYYERGVGPGLDATVYLPKPDFRFKNDTPGWVLVQGYVDGYVVTFELYGTKDGRVATLDGPHTLSTTPAPASVYEETDQLAPGEVSQIEKPHAGATTVANYKVTRNGETLHEQQFTSKYRAMPARYLKGRGESAPAPEPAPAEQTTAAAPAETVSPATTGSTTPAVEPAP